MTSHDIRYFEIAKHVSYCSDFKQHHIGCVITYGHHIISTGWNVNKSSPLQKKYNKYRGLNNDDVIHKMHSEISALSKIKDINGLDNSKLKIYIFRQHKNGVRALAKPCDGCMAAILDIGISSKNIYFTGENCYEKLA